jgi:hypothetical protein
MMCQRFWGVTSARLSKRGVAMTDTTALCFRVLIHRLRVSRYYLTMSMTDGLKGVFLGIVTLYHDFTFSLAMAVSVRT